MVSPNVVGSGSEYFVVYFRMYILSIRSADCVGLPVLLYLLHSMSGISHAIQNDLYERV